MYMTYCTTSSFAIESKASLAVFLPVLSEIISASYVKHRFFVYLFLKILIFESWMVPGGFNDQLKYRIGGR